jgi:hypothetical protein
MNVETVEPITATEPPRDVEHLLKQKYAIWQGGVESGKVYEEKQALPRYLDWQARIIDQIAFIIATVGGARTLLTGAGAGRGSARGGEGNSGPKEGDSRDGQRGKAEISSGRIASISRRAPIHRKPVPL